jgi:hypothetical protein
MQMQLLNIQPQHHHHHHHHHHHAPSPCTIAITITITITITIAITMHHHHNPRSVPPTSTLERCSPYTCLTTASAMRRSATEELKHLEERHTDAAATAIQVKPK